MPQRPIRLYISIEDLRAAVKRLSNDLTERLAIDARKRKQMPHPTVVGEDGPEAVAIIRPTK